VGSDTAHQGTSEGCPGHSATRHPVARARERAIRIDPGAVEVFAGTVADVTPGLATGTAGQDMLSRIENPTAGKGHDSLSGDASDNGLIGRGGGDELPRA
jgi:hypothetical protein